MARLAELFRRYIWNGRILWALFLVSPALFGSLAGRLIEYTTEKSLKAAVRQEKALEKQLGELDRLSTALAVRQQARSAELLRLNAVNADVSARLMVDRLSRLNGQGDIRRITALLYPGDWQARLSATDAILNTDYAADQIGPLQRFENETAAAASAGMVRLQSALNDSAGARETLEERSKWLRWLAEMAGLALTVILFFVKENTGGKGPPAPRQYPRRPWRAGPRKH